MNTVFFKNLGLIDFKEAWDIQESTLSSIISDKKNKKKTKSYLFFCQHPSVYTLGKSGKKEHLLLTDDELKSKNTAFYKINRGGDITYHGPGQLVVYPVFDLDNFFTDIGLFLRTLEELIIKTLQEFNIKGQRSKGETGVWLNNSEPKKICAMGIRASRWVTMHGFALNANTDLSYFKHIVPCGIKNKSVTSISCETNKKTNMDFLKKTIVKNFSLVFNSKIEYDKSVI